MCHAGIILVGDIQRAGSPKESFNITKTTSTPAAMCGEGGQALRTASLNAISEIIEKIRALDH